VVAAPHGVPWVLGGEALSGRGCDSEVFPSVQKGYNPRRARSKSHHPMLPVLAGWNAERRFVVLRKTMREGKDEVWRRLFGCAGLHLPSVGDEPHGICGEIWRDENGRAMLEQRSEERKNDLNADGFCAKRFFATESVVLGVVLSFNLLSLYQARETWESGYLKHSTLPGQRRVEMLLAGPDLRQKLDFASQKRGSMAVTSVWSLGCLQLEPKSTPTGGTLTGRRRDACAPRSKNQNQAAICMR
jgi:hypothetical protein